LKTVIEFLIDENKKLKDQLANVSKAQDELVEFKTELQKQLKILKVKNEREDVVLTRQNDVGQVSK
jgi:peptidoglycan hydrolase CwlO-like protein